MTASSIDRPDTELVSVDVSVSGPLVRVTAAGEIDSSSAPDLGRELDAVLEGALDGAAYEIVVDLVHVTFLDSAGLCVLAAAHRRATERGARLRVLAASRAVIRPLQITGLWDLLHVERVEPGTGSAA